MSKNDSNKDKYWEHDEIENNYKLHFIRFYEDEIIATVFEDEEFSGFYADYELENVPKVEGEPYALDAETIEEAKLEAEEKILELVQEQVEYLQSWIHKFKSIDADENHERLEKGGINHVD